MHQIKMHNSGSTFMDSLVICCTGLEDSYQFLPSILLTSHLTPLVQDPADWSQGWP